MEEPHTDENRGLPEKKHKRIVKTAAQITALENFYYEHKYPSEAMKSELAESIGLTEKQVSGWFCHRRLKDKKPLESDEVGANAKQDRSSGVIQDRGSGLRQDSCGSTKQGGDNNPKEVESKRFTTQGALIPVQVRFDQHKSIRDMDDDDDDTSSGSSSHLKDSFHPQNVKYPTHNDLQSVEGRSGPSGYLKVKSQVENAAITAVKRQLGRNYQVDGPPLGIEFEPLPPGAFENPINNQSYYVGDCTTFHPPDGSETSQLPIPSKMYERYYGRSYDPMDLDESADLEITKNHHPNNQYKSAPPFSKHSRHGRSLVHMASVVNDDYFETRMKHGPDSLSNPHHLIAHGDGKQAENYPPKVHYRDRIEFPDTSAFTYTGVSRKTHKWAREGRGVDEYSKLVSAKVYPGNGMRVTKRSKDEFMHQVYPRMEASVDFPPITNKTKRSTVQMTSRFSDDETAETASSGD